MVTDHGARAKPIGPGREGRAETKFELPKLRGGPCSAQPGGPGEGPGPGLFTQQCHCVVSPEVFKSCGGHMVGRSRAYDAARHGESFSGSDVRR